MRILNGWYGGGRLVDSYKYLSRSVRILVQSWIKREPERSIPWTALPRPLSESRVALVTSAAIALREDQPFDQDGERQDPWWGDPSYRVIPSTATEKDVNIYHLHIDPSYGAQDLNCLLPLQRLAELEAADKIGSSAPSHYSFQGYLLKPQAFLEQSVPAMIRRMQDEQVNVALLAPV